MSRPSFYTRPARPFLSLPVRGSFLLLGAFWFTTTVLPAQTAGHPLLLVANQTNHTLSLVDPATNRETAAIDVVGITGHEVVAIPGRPLAFVPIYGDSGVGRAGTDGTTIDVIDLATRAIVGNVQFDHGVRPHCILYNPHDGLLYVTTELDQAITLIDPKTLKRVGTIPTTQAQSHMLALSHDGRFGYTANVGPGTVSVLDLRARKTVAVIPVSAQTQRISISPDDRLVFTADQTAPRLAVIDTATNTRKEWITLPAIGYGTAPTQDGRWLLVAMRSLNQVAVIDMQTRRVAYTVDVPKTPTEILIRPDGLTAYVSCGAKVAVIDTGSWKVTSLIEAGKGADGLAWAQ